MSPKEKKELQIQRVKWEFEGKLLQFTNGFKSKEEPKIKLSKKEKLSVLAKILFGELDK